MVQQSPESIIQVDSDNASPQTCRDVELGPEEKDPRPSIKTDTATPNDSPEDGTSSEGEESEEEGEPEYPPFAKVLVIMIALYLALFIVALVRHFFAHTLSS